MELHDQTAAAHELVAVIVLDGLRGENLHTDGPKTVSPLKPDAPQSKDIGGPPRQAPSVPKAVIADNTMLTAPRSNIRLACLALGSSLTGTRVHILIAEGPNLGAATIDAITRVGFDVGEVALARPASLSADRSARSKG